MTVKENQIATYHLPLKTVWIKLHPWLMGNSPVGCRQIEDLAENDDRNLEILA